MLFDTLVYARIQLIASSLVFAGASGLFILVDMLDIAIFLLIPLGIIITLTIIIFIIKPDKQAKRIKSQQLARFREIKRRRITH